MKNQFLKFTLTFLLLFVLTLSCEDNPVSNNENHFSNSIEQEVYQLINLHRTGIGLDPLEWSDVIAAECRLHSRDMAGEQTINHDGFNERIERIREKISLNWAGENVAMNWSAQAAVDAWLNSSGHKSNIESNSNLTGVGLAFDADSAMYFTQIFVRSSN